MNVKHLIDVEKFENAMFDTFRLYVRLSDMSSQRSGQQYNIRKKEICTVWSIDTRRHVVANCLFGKADIASVSEIWPEMSKLWG